MTHPRVHRIVLTGGPCSGKRAAVEEIRRRMRMEGRRVFCVPEAATIMGGAAAVEGATPEQRRIFQRGIVRVSLALEDAFYAFAQSLGEPAVLLCDRGFMD